MLPRQIEDCNIFLRRRLKMIDHTLTQSAMERFDCLEAKAGLDNVLVKHQRWFIFHFEPLDGFDPVDYVRFERSNGGNFILLFLLDNY